MPHGMPERDSLTRSGESVPVPGDVQQLAALVSRDLQARRMKHRAFCLATTLGCNTSTWSIALLDYAFSLLMKAGLPNTMETPVVPRCRSSEVPKAFFELIFPDVCFYNLDQFFAG